MKENGFVIGLLVGTVVIAGGLVALGLSQGKKYKELNDEYNEVRANVEKMAKVRPFPTKENEEVRKTEVTAFRGKVEGLQNAMQDFRPESLAQIAPPEFQDRLVAKTNAVKELFESQEPQVNYPERFAFGMENYLDNLANPEATAKLNYQLEAFDWLIQQLVAQKSVYALSNFVREPLPSESGRDWTEDYRQNRLDVPLAQSMPLEITFLADELSANEFLNTIVSSKEHFFIIDAIRIGNENTNAPVRSLAGLEEEDESAKGEPEGGAFGGFGNFNFDEEEETEADEAAVEQESDDAATSEDEEASVVETGKILGQVLGKEGVHVALQLRLLLFNEAIELPDFN